MKKANAGFTLVEQIAVISMLLIVMTIVGGSLTALFEHYRLQRQMLDDHNDIRMAMLGLTRDINQRDPQGNVIITTGPVGFSFNTALVGGHAVTYEFVDRGGGNWWLQRDTDPAHPVFFVPVQLAENGLVVTQHTDTATGNEWLTIRFIGRGFGGMPGHELEATLSLNRLVPQATP